MFDTHCACDRGDEDSFALPFAQTAVCSTLGEAFSVVCVLPRYAWSCWTRQRKSSCIIEAYLGVSIAGLVCVTWTMLSRFRAAEQAPSVVGRGGWRQRMRAASHDVLITFTHSHHRALPSTSGWGESKHLGACSLILGVRAPRAQNMIIVELIMIVRDCRICIHVLQATMEFYAPRTRQVCSTARSSARSRQQWRM